MPPATAAQSRIPSWLKIIGIVACVYVFIVGIGAMGQSFKLFGKDFSQKILETTASPLVGLFIGILATALVQSSSTTTSVIVGMVAGDALTLEAAIPMIMGANIGTTITNLLVSLGHITRTVEFRRAFAAATIHDFFNWITVFVLFPVELLTQKFIGAGLLASLSKVLAQLFSGLGGMRLSDPLKAATKPAVDWLSSAAGNHAVALLIVSVLLIFAMLTAIVKILRSLVLRQVEAFFDEHLFKNAGRAMLFGCLLTVAVQSSSITTSLVIPLAGAGILRLSQIFPYTLGANVGTTMTAILAALATGSPVAIQVAFAHLWFNLLGILFVWPVPRIRGVPVRAAEWLAELSMRNRMIPVAFVLLIFFVVPLLLILLFR